MFYIQEPNSEKQYSNKIHCFADRITMKGEKNALKQDNINDDIQIALKKSFKLTRSRIGGGKFSCSYHAEEGPLG